MDYNGLMKFIKSKYSSCYNNSGYYSNITNWLAWYKGYVPEVHKIRITNGLEITERKMYRLYMAKRVCEDWTSSVLSEGMGITVGGNKSNRVFIQGGKGFGGVLGSNNFVNVLSQSVEQMFGLGTSAWVLEISGVGVDNSGNIVSRTENSRIDISYYDATRIIPLSWKNGIIRECAFVSELVKDGKTFYTVSMHLLDTDGYVIYNYFIDSNYNIVKQNNGILPFVRTKSYKPFFFIIKPNITNNIDMYSPMGISVYANALDNVAGCDIIYDSCITEVITGQRIVMMHKALLTTTDCGEPIAPQDIKKNYMMFYGDDAVKDIKEFIKEFHPTLNTEQLDKEMQNQLNMLSAKVGFGTKFYNFDISGGVTATEYVGERNDFIKNSTKMTNLIAKQMKDMISAILYIGKEILNRNVDSQAEIDVSTSDGVVEDDKEKREQDRQDVKDGIMSKAEYRAKWYNESIEDAEKKLQEIEKKS